jgi:hypothetical protein
MLAAEQGINNAHRGAFSRLDHGATCHAIVAIFAAFTSRAPA